MNREIRTYSSDKALVEERRKGIVRCASKAFVKKGYDRTTMNELAEAFGSSKGGLYHYVGSKEDILYLILESTISVQQEYLVEIRKKTANLDPTETLTESIKVLLERVDEYQDMYVFNNHVMVNLGKNERRMMFDASDELVAYFESLLVRGIEAGEFEISDPRLLAGAVVALTHSWAQNRWFLRKRYTLPEYTKAQTELIVKAVRVDTSKAIASQEDMEQHAGISIGGNS